MISSLMVLKDPQIHSDFFTLSVSLPQLPCVFAFEGLTLRPWAIETDLFAAQRAASHWDDLLMTGLCKSLKDQLPCSELAPALELNLYARALQDQGVAIFCETSPEITSLLDFYPFSSLFLLRTLGFS